MEEINYYSMALDDYLYLQYSYEHNLVRNAMTNLAQHICEKFLKHIIVNYYSGNATDVLKAHSLRKILNFIRRNIPDFECDRQLILNADGYYYYSTRYPGDDAFFVNQEDVELCWKAVCETKRAVDLYLATHNISVNDSLSSLDLFN